MNHTSIEAIPPGEYIRDELEARNWSSARLAAATGLPITTVELTVAGKRAITVETAKTLASAFGTTPDLWLGLQYAFDLSRASQSKNLFPSRKLNDIAPGFLSN